MAVHLILKNLGTPFKLGPVYQAGRAHRNKLCYSFAAGRLELE